jgi:hypothetical protein
MPAKTSNCFPMIFRSTIKRANKPKGGKTVHLTKRKTLSIGAVFLLPLLTSAWAADIIGKWFAQVPAGQGTVQTVFTFRMNGTNLLGTVSNPQGETAINEGKINGDEISFSVIRNLGGKEMQLVYKGKVAGDEIKFTREVQGGGQPEEFIAKREFQRNGDIPVIKSPRR